MDQFIEAFDLQGSTFEHLPGYDSHNWLVTTSEQKRFILKHHMNPADWGHIQAENEMMRYLNARVSFEVSHPVAEEMPRFEDGSFARLLNCVEGEFLFESDRQAELLENFGRATAEITRALAGYRNPVLQANYQSWDLKHSLHVWSSAQALPPEKRKLVDYFLDRYRHFVEPHAHKLRHQLLHGDLNDRNVLVTGHDISGVIDFGDACYSPVINELAIACTYIMLSTEDPVERACQVIYGFAQREPLSELEVDLLGHLIPTRLCASMCHAAKKIIEGADTEYVLVDQTNIWNLLERWITFSPEAIRQNFRQAAGLPVSKQPDTGQILKSRNENSARNLSLSYQQPIHMTSAAFQYMYSADRKTYLDAYNNIPHIGHCHPRVTEALARQVRLLNTNTRYLYGSMARYSERILDLFPATLNKIFYVNSGSAASDLALRLARHYTSRQAMLVLEHGYHGHTQAGIEISSYKFQGKGGKGPEDHVSVLPLPKLFNGALASGPAYAEDAINRIDRLSDVPAAFIAEPISGCGGQVPLAEGYLSKLKPYLDQRKIVTIMDEVQVGFGRVGTHFWAFQQHDIVPDIVVLGKPMGNGHPIGAVVTTTEIADSFANGMEFFSSFGGNPISLEVAHAVLEVIEEEGLQVHAREVGAYFENMARKLAQDYSLIGDIRCRGLFLGLEIVDPTTGQPGTKLASAIKNGMKERLVLTGTDGPYESVLKMKPPLCFNKANVDQFFEVLQATLQDIQLK